MEWRLLKCKTIREGKGELFIKPHRKLICVEIYLLIITNIVIINSHIDTYLPVALSVVHNIAVFSLT